MFDRITLNVIFLTSAYFKAIILQTRASTFTSNLHIALNRNGT